MTGETENLILELLRKIRGEQQAMALDIMDIKSRISTVEETIGTLAAQYANQGRRIDRIEDRLSRIERRLDLVEEPHA
jgi:archaellum component FlaC